MRKILSCVILFIFLLCGILFAQSTTVQSFKSPLSVLHGGTNASSFTSGYLPYFDGTRLVISPVYTDGMNIGVGTSAPSGTLHFYKDANSANKLLIENPNTGNAAFNRLSLNTSVATAYLDLYSPGFATSGAITPNGTNFGADGDGGFSIGATHASGALRFYTGGSGSANERMRITSSGNVGIGTATPNYKLEVKDGAVGLSGTNVAHGMTDIAPTDVFFKNNIYSNTYGGVQQVALSDGDSPALSFAGIVGSTSPTSAPITFQAGKKSGTTWQALAGTEYAFSFENTSTGLLTIMGDGRIGIGTTTPTASLEVKGSSTGNVLIGALSDFPAYGAIGLGNSISSANANFYSLTATPNLFINRPSGYDIYIAENGTQFINFKSGGKVGIGNLAPSEVLDVKGNIKYSGTTGGLVYKTTEAVCTTTAATTCVITLNIPTNSRLLGAQLRVDTALAAGETWGAAYSGGSTTTIASTGQAVAKNTKINKMHVDEVTTNTTNITITRDAGSFTAGGVIRAIVYTNQFEVMADAP